MTKRRGIIVEHMFRTMVGLSPSDSYKLLVLLVEARAIDAVITTNFDVMLEEAEGSLSRRVFDVFAPGVARPFRSQGRPFNSPNVPYLKLHGDLQSRDITVLTQDEIDTAVYDAAMLEFAKEILASHHIIFAGYSGYDTALARELCPSICASSRRIFWCNPTPLAAESPFAIALGESELVTVHATFDEMVEAIARPILESAAIPTPSATYIPRLIDWRIQHHNDQFVKEYAWKRHRDQSTTFVRRHVSEEQLRRFLSSTSGLGSSCRSIRVRKDDTGHSITQHMVGRLYVIDPH